VFSSTRTPRTSIIIIDGCATRGCPRVEVGDLPKFFRKLIVAGQVGAAFLNRPVIRFDPQGHHVSSCSEAVIKSISPSSYSRVLAWPARSTCPVALVSLLHSHIDLPIDE